ncbi:hypothetical protein PROFUN_10371 [Planoprotostelium fungivorum]|uniref:AB hydrolase-1 domain-containing protein n=1 Tax=Planoprotostelium fungivorum TaxID=1890364 RepID=A0A2P6NEB2_9EUKA|nr:hypothetical protein PROFUN_10371 [Planoprotostelium fungivorum]
MQTHTVTLSVTDQPTFEYTDSGHCDGDHDTFIAIHGNTFTKESFDELIKKKPHNTRVIAVNLRGYDGSSAPSPLDMKLLHVDHSPEYGQRRAAEIAEFISIMIDRNNIKPQSLVLLSWSMGVTILMGILHHSSTLHPEHMSSISKAVRRLVFLDPPSDFITGQPASAVLERLSDLPNLANWFKSWCIQTFERPSDIPTDREGRLLWAQNSSSETPHPNADEILKHHRSHTFPFAFFHVYPPYTEATESWTKSVIFPVTSSSMTQWSRDVAITWLWCTKSVPMCTMAGIWAEDHAGEGRLERVVKRKWNHAFLWDHPDETWAILLDQ